MGTGEKELTLGNSPKERKILLSKEHAQETLELSLGGKGRVLYV